MDDSLPEKGAVDRSPALRRGFWDGRKATKGFAMSRNADQVSDRRVPEGLLNGLGSVVQAAMQRAEVDTVQPERTFVKAAHWVENVDDFQHR